MTIESSRVVMTIINMPAQRKAQTINLSTDFGGNGARATNRGERLGWDKGP